MAEATSPTDKTDAPVTVTREEGKFTVAIEGETAGLTAFAERDGQRVFFHTEVAEAFGGHGLATVLIAEALAATRADGLRIIAMRPTVAACVKNHHDFDDIADRPTGEILEWLRR